MNRLTLSVARTTNFSQIAAHLAMWVLVGLLLAPALGADGFWWNDEPRHAMGGVFVLDFFRDMPLNRPLEYAWQYFARYPAVALNWYLPGFYVVEAVFFSFLGVEESTARLAVFSFCALAGSAWLTWTRRTWGGFVAAACVATMLSNPLWVFWSRSVMLEVPSIALFMLAILAFEKYLRSPTIFHSCVAGIVIATALMFKQTVALLLPSLLIYAVFTSNRRSMFNRRAIPAYLLVTFALALVALHAWKFGSLGLAATLGDNRTALGLSATRFSIDRWTLYPSLLVDTWGAPLCLMSFIGAALPNRSRESGLPLVYIWLLVWYISFTLVLGAPENAPRYTLYAFPALAVLAARPLFVFQNHRLPFYACLATLIVAVGHNVWQAVRQPIEQVSGYRKAAEFVKKSGTSSPVLFAGQHGGNFIFHLRRLNPQHDNVVLRADKMLVSLAIHKYFGMPSHVKNEEEIFALVQRYGIQFIVIEQPDILQIREFAMLNNLLQQPNFLRVATIPVVSSAKATAPTRIEVYKNMMHKPQPNAIIQIPLPHMGREIRFQAN